MKFTVAKALEMPSINQCKIVGGNNGANRVIESVNSFDAPDVLSWLKPNELVLTTGYVFQDDPDRLAQLVSELAAKQCAGLAIKIEKVPKTVIQIANDSKLPLLKIPVHCSLADIMTPLLREIVSRQQHDVDSDKITSFFSRLVNEESGDEAFVHEYEALGLSRNSGYSCLSLKTLQADSLFDKALLLQLIKKVLKQNEIDQYVAGWMKDDVLILLENKNNMADKEFNEKVYSIAEKLAAVISEQLSGLKFILGIGNHLIGINHVHKTCNEAVKTANLGNILQLGKDIYTFNEIEAFTILQHAPNHVLEEFVSSNLSPLVDHDTAYNSDLVHTLDVYLQCLLRPAEAARVLGVHRNTIHFRIRCIKDIIKNDLTDAACLFKLQLALYTRRLLKKKKTTV